MHPFDDSLRLTPAIGRALRGQAAQHYWNMVGPYGGITAAQMLQAVLVQPDCQGDPLSLTTNFVAPVREGEFEIDVALGRTGRSTQHWRMEMRQADPASGESAVVMQALAVMGMRRDLWSAQAVSPPQVPPPDGLARRRGRDGLAWFERYDLRFTRHPMKADDPREPLAHWMRDDPPRPLDYPALAAICDTFFPAIFAHRKSVMPIATVTMNVYFHADRGDLAAIGDGWLLGQGRSQVFREGFFDAEAQVWAGERLLATTHQVMWYRD